MGAGSFPPDRPESIKRKEKWGPHLGRRLRLILCPRYRERGSIWIGDRHVHLGSQVAIWGRGGSAPGHMKELGVWMVRRTLEGGGGFTSIWPETPHLVKEVGRNKGKR